MLKLVVVKKGTKKPPKRAFFATVIILFLLLGSGILSYKFIKSQFKPVIETPKGEVKKLPPDITNELREENKRATPSARLMVPILMYHYVEYVTDKRDTIRQSLNINPNVFEDQIKTLLAANYTFITAKELGEAIDGKISLPVKPILLTFDDGHWDLDTIVLPILKKYNVKATAYIIPGFLGGSDFMTKKELQDVVDSRLVDIGAHTVHHVSLKGKLLPVVQYEVEQSKKMLEDTYHIHVVSFAYPNGAFDKQAEGVVKNEGFTTAVSTVPGIAQSRQNEFFLYRLRPGYKTGNALLFYLQDQPFRLQ